ncbi:MAG: hypothetical protein CMJ52_08225 [Planctomycetaceae bacterium]|nr:hypothetical protein [Planctomycetaceae bacterium]
MTRTQINQILIVQPALMTMTLLIVILMMISLMKKQQRTQRKSLRKSPSMMKMRKTETILIKAILINITMFLNLSSTSPKKSQKVTLKKIQWNKKEELVRQAEKLLHLKRKRRSSRWIRMQKTFVIL